MFSDSEKLANAIKSKTLIKRPVLIAIGGYGGSGKTTFANKLRDALGSAYVVNIDDFIVKEKLNELSWDKGGFDRKRLEEQILKPATHGRPINYRQLIWQTDTLSEPKSIPTVDYLIIEGISSYHPDIARYYNWKIWVEAPIEIAKARGKARDKGNENEGKWDLWADNDLRYQSKHHPEKNANFIIKGF